MQGASNPTIERTRPLRRSGVLVARGARGLLRLCVVLFFLIIILLAIITVSARIGLPFLAAYKPALEDRLSDYLQSPVSIAELDTRWVGTGPVLRALGVELTDPQGRQTRFEELLIDVDLPRSILTGSPVMDELTLIGANLAVDYDPETGVAISGLSRASSRTGEANGRAQEIATNANSREKGFNAIAWLLNASRVGMLDTKLTLQLPDASSLIIDNINIRVENGDNLHQVRMDLSLPPELGGGFEIGVDLRGNVTDLSNAGGNFYIKAADVNADGIKRILEGYGLEHNVLEALAKRGTKAQLELWGQLKSGNVERVSGRTAIEQSIADDPEIDSLFGNLSWEREASGGWQFAASDVVVGRSGAESVFDEIRLGAQRGNGLRPEWLTLRTAETELKPILNTITTLVPSAIPAPAFAWLESASLSSKIRSADLRLSTLNPADSFTLVAQLDDTQWSPVARKPGARVQTLDVNIINGVGKIQIPTQSVTVLPPALNVRNSVEAGSPLMLNEVNWQADVNLPQNTLEGDVSIQHRSLDVDLSHALKLSGDNTPHLEAAGTFSAKTVSDVKPWLSQSWMPAGARNWLKSALLKGAVSNGSVEVSGTLTELASRDPEGQGSSVLKTQFDAQNLSLRYLDAWPVASDVNARVVFDHANLSTSIRTGTVGGVPLDKGTAIIDDLYNAELQLTLSSNAPLRDLVEFSEIEPLSGIVGPVLGGSKVSGPARIELSVVTPLRRPKQAGNGSSKWPVTVRGNVFLTDSEMTLGALESLPLSGVRGAIGFTETGIELKSVRANLFGSAIRLNAASAGAGRDRRTDVAVRTVMPVRTLLDEFDLPVAQFANGSSSWRADASIPHDSARIASEGISLTVTSDLVGTAISLAQPFGKRSNRELPLRVSTRFKDSTGTVANPQIWRLVFGDRTNPETDVRIAVADDEGMQGLLLSLGESLNDRQPEEGIRVVGRADVLSLDGLVENISDIIDAIPDGGGPPTLIPPVFVDVYGPHLRAGDTRIGDVSVKVNTDEKFVNFYINNAHLRGNLRYPREHWRRDIDIKARINYADKILIDALTSGAKNSLEPAERIDPTTLPPVEIHVNKFDWLPLQLNDLRIYAEPDIAGMKIKTFGFATGTTQLIGEGSWHLVDPQNVNPALANAQTARLNLTLQSSDFGNALTALGFDGVMADGEGRVSTSLTWPDAIYAPDLELMTGRADVDIRRGQLLQIEPGAARLVGLFALQTLPRRFNLDFADLVKDGLDFATITGDIGIDSGVAEMRLVQLNGPVGVVDITGLTNLVDEEFNQTITVLPRVSAALPIIGIITGGATAGIGALIAGGVLKAAGVDFDRIGLQKYSLTGGWDNPNFRSIRR